MKNKRYDIFISYAHANNAEKDENDKGWIDHFYEKIMLGYQNTTGENLVFWLDQVALSCGDVLKKINDDGLENTKLFIPILSPPYIKSEWCRKEFLRFEELARESNSLHINNKSRILPIILFPFEDIKPNGNREIEEFDRIKTILNPGDEEEILYQKFFEEKNYMKYQLKANKNEFNDQCHIFSQVLGNTLRDIIDIEIEKKISEPGIFLGLTSSNSIIKRKNIFNELKSSRKYKSLKFSLKPDEEGLDSNALEKLSLKIFKAQTIELIKTCNSSYHILDSTYGRTPEDSHLSYLELQYDIASQQAKEKNSIFKCYVSISDIEINDERQEKFINKIYADIENFPDNIVPINFTNAKELSEILITTIEIKHITTTKGSKEQILLMLNTKDEESKLAKKIDDYIFEKKIEVRKPIFRRSKDNLDDFEKNFNDSLEKCDKAIIFYGSNATDGWCNSIKIDILKSAKDANTRIAKKAICVTDPDVKKRIRNVRSQYFDIIDCEGDNFFENLDKFINS